MNTAVFFYAFVGGVMLGALLAYLISRGHAADLDRQRRELLAKLESALGERGRLEAERNSLAAAQESLRDSFKALAADALRDSNTQFLQQAKTLLEGLVQRSQTDLEDRRKAIHNLVEPLQTTLTRMEGEIQGMEGKRQEAYVNLEKELARLQHETGSLTSALRRPQGRGRWGEITLRRVVEVAGMSDYCDFSEQKSLEASEGEEGRRPDLVIHLPGRREIVVDSKTPLDAYLDAVETASESDRAAALKRHAAQVRKQMEQLSDKSYWSRLSTSPEFVVLFLPGESFFSAALEQDRTLIEDGIEKRVILATPTTLIALLKAVAYGWRQEQVAVNSQRISDLGKEMYDRVLTLTDHLRDLGAALGKATQSYNKAIGSYENRIVVSARRFKELGATASEDIPVLEPLDQVPRTPEVGQQSLDPTWKEDLPS